MPYTWESLWGFLSLGTCLLCGIPNPTPGSAVHSHKASLSLSQLKPGFTPICHRFTSFHAAYSGLISHLEVLHDHLGAGLGDPSPDKSPPPPYVSNLPPVPQSQPRRRAPRSLTQGQPQTATLCPSHRLLGRSSTQPPSATSTRRNHVTAQPTRGTETQFQRQNTPLTTPARSGHPVQTMLTPSRTQAQVALSHSQVTQASTSRGADLSFYVTTAPSALWSASQASGQKCIVLLLRVTSKF
jgi:hypothetical protein